MDWILSLITTLAIFAAALLILVFFHELGHFLAAKLFGMRVERFSLGFPPRIFGIKKGETDYCIGATPLGGYVKISGMLDESMDTDYLDEEPKPWEFRSKPVWQRIIVISAGVIFNMILAVLIYSSLAFTTGDMKVQLNSVDGVYVAPGSLASQVGFQTGDKLIGVNGHDVKYFQDLFAPDQMTASALSYTVLRNGKRVTIPIADSLLNDIGKRGFISLSDAMPNLSISQVEAGAPADKAGLKAGDKIVAINGKDMKYLEQTISTIGHSKDSLSLSIERNGAIKHFEVKPNDDHKLGIVFHPSIADNFDVQKFNYGFFQSLGVGVKKANETVTGILQGFKKMFTGAISIRENLGGPVAIANVTKQATEAGGAIGFWNITAFLSVTLAIMNILPIPVLDGGHLMFLIYEGITRREPSPKVRMALQQIGFLLIIALFIFVTFNDILRQFG
ncbi:MAG TPA: RIP metalloprotease RseP [Balneolaceae bacterium]|nr:RIP metalloprotease RseP [Balneolaceae bacterium]